MKGRQKCSSLSVWLVCVTVWKWWDDRSPRGRRCLEGTLSRHCQWDQTFNRRTMNRGYNSLHKISDEVRTRLTAKCARSQTRSELGSQLSAQDLARRQNSVHS